MRETNSGSRKQMEINWDLETQMGKETEKMMD